MQRLWAPWRMTYLRSEDRPDHCIFCLNGEEQGDPNNLVLYRDESAFVMMNRFPYTSGHLLVVPNRHVAVVTDLDVAAMNRLGLLLRACIAVLRENLGCEGFNLGMNVGNIAGAGVKDHLHWHIVPRWSGDTNFMPVLTDTRVINQYLDETYKDLQPAFGRLVWTGEDYDRP